MAPAIARAILGQKKFFGPKMALAGPIAVWSIMSVVVGNRKQAVET
jgi:hypothetical protein